MNYHNLLKYITFAYFPVITRNNKARTHILMSLRAKLLFLNAGNLSGLSSTCTANGIPEVGRELRPLSAPHLEIPGGAHITK